MALDLHFQCLYMHKVQLFRILLQENEYPAYLLTFPPSERKILYLFEGPKNWKQDEEERMNMNLLF